MMTFAPLMKTLHGATPDLDLYTIDHRGVGYSSPLSCPDQEAEDSEGGGYIYLDEFPACIDWLNDHVGDALQGYSTRNAAHDLAAFIDATRQTGKAVYVWGSSYGTYVVERYLLLHPDQADAAILDSIHAVSVPALAFAPYYNQNGKRLLDLCGTDAFCSSKLGSDPWSRLNQLYQKLETGHCAALGMDHYTLAYLLGWLAWYSAYNPAAPAMIYRLDRCDPADMEAIVYMFYNPFNGSGDLIGLDEGWWSPVLSTNIGFSDQYWGPQFDGVDIEAYIAQMNQEILFGVIPTMDQHELYLMWPRYDEPQARVLPETSIPVLMLQGALDGATPLETALPLRSALDASNQQWFLFPYSAHGVINDSWVSTDWTVPTCALTMYTAFLADPTAPVDDSCIAETLPVGFAGSTELAQYMFNTDDLWENPPAKRAKQDQRSIDPTALRRWLPPRP
jgi:pimeloyl-ACP methyl ester carboxylesterase